MKKIAVTIVCFGFSALGLLWFYNWYISQPHQPRPLFHVWTNDYERGWMFRMEGPLRDSTGALAYVDQPLNMVVLIYAGPETQWWLQEIHHDSAVVLRKTPFETRILPKTNVLQIVSPGVSQAEFRINDGVADQLQQFVDRSGIQIEDDSLTRLVKHYYSGPDQREIDSYLRSIGRLD